MHSENRKMTTIDRVIEYLNQYHDIPRRDLLRYENRLVLGTITPRQLLVDLAVFIPDWVDYDSENAKH